MDVNVDGLSSHSLSHSIAQKLKSSEVLNSASSSSNNLDGSEPETGFLDDTEDCFETLVDDEEDYGDYDDDNSDCDGNDLLDDYDLKVVGIENQYDDVDIPPGVEASFPWLKDSTSAVEDASTSAFSDRKVDVDGGSKPVQISYNYKNFDIVEDFSDHYFSAKGFVDHKPPKDWSKRIQDEWKILENNLPDTIFVRTYEARIDLLRAVIIGPSGTPYHDGLFVFDCIFPTNYPSEPPKVHYYSGGLRLNPNLYQCGKVCLSLLGTWPGDKKCENWISNKSTMLQVLVSIQALILNEKPFFNEPGYESRYRGWEGETRSTKYNEEVFILSMKTMVYTLNKPPKHFEQLVAVHFRDRIKDILAACKAYKAGTPIGSMPQEVTEDADAENQVDDQVEVREEFKEGLTKATDLFCVAYTKFETNYRSLLEVLP